MEAEYEYRIARLDPGFDISRVKPGYRYSRERYAEKGAKSAGDPFRDMLSSLGLLPKRDIAEIAQNKEFTMLKVTNESTGSVSWRALFNDSSVTALRDIPDASILLRAKEFIQECLAREGVELKVTVSYFNLSAESGKLQVDIADISGGFEGDAFTGSVLLLDTAIKNFRMTPGFNKEGFSCVRPFNAAE